MITAIQLGSALRNLRESRNYSLEDVAKLTGKARQTIFKYEQGLISMSLEVLQDLLNVYGVSVGKFLDDLE